ncbi:hypothetical protein [Actinomadura roseirufa]|uniref:hypothetical protein n=1 Tax=Actinomadura roseirufa TaxID=2094049 RepID=UPI0010418548|nr:hypothetical protein [Actinomadura roseirufa]
MDLESELRKAMAEQVADASAPPSLAADVKRRHRRRATRIRAVAGTAVAAVAALALVPTYQSFRATPAAAPVTSAPSGDVSVSRQPERRPVPGVPTPPPQKGKPGTGTSARPPGTRPSGEPAEPGGSPAEPGAPGAVPSPPGWVTYLPGGLTATSPCAVTGDTGRRTTTCGWRGASASVEISVTRGSGFGLGDLAPPAGVPGHTSVHGTPALTGARPGAGRQVAWMARPGVGVLVAAGGSAEGQLLRIAEGVRP